MNQVSHWSSINIWKIDWIWLISTSSIFLILGLCCTQLCTNWPNLWLPFSASKIIFHRLGFWYQKMARYKQRPRKDTIIYVLKSQLHLSKEVRNMSPNRHNKQRLEFWIFTGGDEKTQPKRTIGCCRDGQSPYILTGSDGWGKLLVWIGWIIDK